jgi:hypothetical protein
MISSLILIDVGNVSSYLNVQIAKFYGVLFRESFLPRGTTQKISGARRSKWMEQAIDTVI